MVGKKARQHFEEMNCAQAVLKAFQEERGITEKEINEFAECGRGKATGGACGALHAARYLTQDNSKRTVLDQQFSEVAGALTCHEIRKLKRLDCAGCVETAAVIAQQCGKI